MSLLGVDFSELYARHLCRHSQFGINVAHMVALFGTWLGVYGVVGWLAHWAIDPAWVLVPLAIAYMAAIAVNVPVRALVATGLLVVLLLAAYYGLRDLPVWVFALLVPVCYKLQTWSHKVWNVERDMTEFNRKYPKGRLLFVVLLLYDPPILLNYLLFDKQRGVA
jgi:hypothetical protein